MNTKQAYCAECGGQGVLPTGILEIPIAQCKACNGTGMARALYRVDGTDDPLRVALTEIVRLRLATSEGTCAKRFDRAWQIATDALAIK